MFAAPDASTVDLTRTTVKLRADVVVTPQSYRDETFYHLELPSKSQFYRIGQTEYVFLSLLDGNTTFSEALALTARAQGATAFSQEQAISLYSWLLEQNITVFVDSEVAGTPATSAESKLSQLVPKLNPFWIRIPFGRPDALFRLLMPVFGWLFSPGGTFVGITVMLAAVVQLYSAWDQYEAASATVFASDNWIWLLVAWLLLKVLHETAHGLTCQRYGGEVRETGVIFAFFAPLAYVDVTSCWAFQSKWKRIHTASAGMYVELLLAAVAVFAWPYVTSEVASHLVYNIIVMASFSTIMFNINPLMRFDGYYILSDLLQIPNLYSQSSQALQQLCNRTLFGVRGSSPELSGNRVHLLQVYGIAAFAWRLLICGSMMIAASVLFHGAGVVLSIAGMVAWFAVPLWKNSQEWTRIARTAPARLVRASVVVTLLALTVGCVFLLPVPFGTTAPGTVSLHEGCRIRTEADGFVQAVHVEDGQAVRQGDLLVSLRNDDIANRYADLKLQVQQESVRRQIAMTEHNPGLASIAEGNLRSLTERLTEAARQLKALEVRAPADGQVLARNLHFSIGTFVQEGDDLLSIDDRSPRELHISVAQEDFPLASRQVEQTVAVRLGTRPSAEGRLIQVIPRATKQLPHPALAATDGGSLPVTSTDSDEEGTELTEARFRAVVELTAVRCSEQLPIGERGHVTLGRTDRSLGRHLYHKAAGWLEDQLATAVRESRL